MLTALQSTALPLVIEFSFTKEIEDRLLAPMPTALVAVEKIVFAAMRAMIAALVMFPVGFLVLGSVPWRAGAAAAVHRRSWCSARWRRGAMGLTLGTLVPPNRINIMFALVLTPLLFTGCTQYPWPSLEHAPLVPGRDAVQPDDLRQRGHARRAGAGRPAHPAVDLPAALIASLAIFGSVGIRGFIRRAID